MLTGLLGAIVGAAGSMAGSAMQTHAASAATGAQYKYTKWLNEAADARSYDYARKLWQEQQSSGVPLQMAAMRRAGINPLLAVGGISGGSMPSFSGHSGSVSPTDTSGYAGIATGISNAVAHYLTAKQIQSQVELNAANASKAIQATKDDHARLESDLELAKLEAAVKAGIPEKTKEEIKELQGRIMLNDSQKSLIQSQISRNAAEVEYKAWDRAFRESTKNRAGLPFGMLEYHFGDVDGASFYDTVRNGAQGAIDLTNAINKDFEIERKIEEYERRKAKEKYWKDVKSFPPPYPPHGRFFKLHGDDFIKQ